MHRVLPLIVVSIALSTTLRAQFANTDLGELGPDTRTYDQIHLDLDLQLEMDDRRVQGVATHRVRALVDGLESIRMHAVELDVTEVRADDAIVSHAVDEGLLWIELGRSLRRGEEITLAISYGASPRKGLYFFKPSEQHPTIPYQVWSQGQGVDNRHWIPCYDLPDDRLTTTVKVTVQQEFEVLSNGRRVALSEPDEAGRRIHEWAQERPHVTYLITLVVGKLATIEEESEGVPLQYLVPHGWEPHVEGVFGRTPRMLAHFNELMGVPYPWPQYAQVTVWDFMYGGMENTGATTLNMRALFKENVRPNYSADGLIAHELVHMWYGDLITCKTFNHIWLNEGFATYFTDLWFEEDEGRDSFLVRRLRSKEAYLGRVDLTKVAAGEAPRFGHCGDVASHPYVKGSSVLHMLRTHLGEETWTRAVHEYTRRFADRSIDSEDMRTVFEEVSGEDLGWFWRQWVYGSGFPELAVQHRWHAGELTVQVDQTQAVTDAMPAFVLPTEIVWEDAQGTRTSRRVTIHREHCTLRFTCPTPPAFVHLDPEGVLVCRIDVRADLAAWIAQLAGEDGVIGRLLAARQLAEHGGGALPALVRASREDAAWEVRREAIRSLGRIAGTQASAALAAAATGDRDARVREAAVEQLGGRPAGQVMEPLAQVVATEPQDYVVAAAALAVARSKLPEARDTLLTLLERESHRDIVRQRAVDGLRELGVTEAVPDILPFLDYRHGRGIQHRLRKATLDALVDLAPDHGGFRAKVFDLCTDPYFRMRTWALDAAAKLRVDAIVPIASELAQSDPSDAVRAAATRTVEALAFPPADPAETTPDTAPSPTAEERARQLEREAERAKLRADIFRLQQQLEQLEGESRNATR